MSHSSGERDSGDSPRQIPAGASVLVKNGFYEGLEVMLEADSTVIGRGRRADVVIVEPTISREHASIGFDGDRFFVNDLASTLIQNIN